MKITSLILVLFGFLNCNLTTSVWAADSTIEEAQNFSQFLSTEKSIFIRAKSESEKSVIIIHGLNLKPSKMNNVAEFYYNEGFNVLRLSLKGHDGDWQAYKSLKADDWVLNVEEAFAYIKKINPNSTIDLFGYSLGAVAGVAAEQNGNIDFHRVVLAAPAFEVTKVATLIEALFQFENLNVPSRFSPIHISGYAVHSATPIIAYKALFELRKRVQKNVPLGFINKSGLLFISKKDEVVDANSTVSFVEAVSSFQTIYVEKKKSTLKPVMHHLIIDEPSLGETWSEMTDEIRRLNALR